MLKDQATACGPHGFTTPDPDSHGQRRQRHHRGAGEVVERKKGAYTRKKLRWVNYHIPRLLRKESRWDLNWVTVDAPIALSGNIFHNSIDETEKKSRR